MASTVPLPGIASATKALRSSAGNTAACLVRLRGRRLHACVKWESPRSPLLRLGCESKHPVADFEVVPGLRHGGVIAISQVTAELGIVCDGAAPAEEASDDGPTSSALLIDLRRGSLEEHEDILMGAVQVDVKTQ